ncbi:MAG: hypothetical protein DRQ49_15505 [Gammaproteobacteria bacterium]|nr:MAG: hypothetical protein DRQ49_15505 [Gammaproteobacteria bacterium]RKZ43383.1 MAG: hypothetical protein DRQ41_05470 [Gammaproteobacteria bacterium]RKZ77321.1 MAG: hypothetical protein DRQ57_00420 [Gammaproteobacteria bacterium]
MNERKQDLLKEIDLIQSIINRMSNTSFLIKGWAVTMISFIFAFRANPETLPLVFIPLILFWFLDAYFLQQERLYRKLYKWVIENRMTDDSHLFSLSTVRFKKSSLLRVMFSITLGAFYGTALLLNVIYLIFRLWVGINTGT